MTKAGKKILIDALSLRIFEIQEARARLAAEELKLRGRIYELETDDPISPTPVVML